MSLALHKLTGAMVGDSLVFFSRASSSNDADHDYDNDDNSFLKISVGLQCGPSAFDNTSSHAWQPKTGGRQPTNTGGGTSIPIS